MRQRRLDLTAAIGSHAKHRLDAVIDESLARPA
jgi:hypothetical protein